MCFFFSLPLYLDLSWAYSHIFEELSETYSFLLDCALVEHLDHLHSHISLLSAASFEGLEEARFALSGEQLKWDSCASLLELEGAVEQELDLCVEFSDIVVLLLSEPFQSFAESSFSLADLVDFVAPL